MDRPLAFWIPHNHASVQMKSVAEKCFEENIGLQQVDALGRPKDPAAWNLYNGLRALAEQQGKILAAQAQLQHDLAHVSRQVAEIARR